MDFDKDRIEMLLKAPNNCSMLAMSLAGLIPDGNGLTRGGMRVYHMEENVYKQAHMQRVISRTWPEKCGAPRSLKQFAAQHPEGIFITISRDHFAVVVDGEILNSHKWIMHRESMTSEWKQIRVIRNQKITEAWHIVKREPAMMGSY